MLLQREVLRVYQNVESALEITKKFDELHKPDRSESKDVSGQLLEIRFEDKTFQTVDLGTL